jgi:hypothetical protein
MKDNSLNFVKSPLHKRPLAELESKFSHYVSFKSIGAIELLHLSPFNFEFHPKKSPIISAFLKYAGPIHHTKS